MEGYWLISYIALWLVVITLGVVILSHSRLIGLLHHRLSPSAAKPLDDGPAVGSRVPEISGHTLQGAKWVHDFPGDSDVLLVFLSPLCELCNELAPHALDFAAAHRDVAFILVSTLGDPGMNRAFVQYRRLEKLRYYIAPALAEQLSISGTPYAIFLNSQGIVQQKGLVNHYEHLRSLLRTPRGEVEPAGRQLGEELNEEVRENG
jgi:methylamine dehydrogenase accessory protein MauD